MMNTVSVKVYYLENGVNKEIRRFNMDANVAGSVEYLMGKIKLVFTGLLRKDLLIYWKDEEGDFISISLDEELVEIMNKFIGTSEHLKLYVKGKAGNSSPINNIHSGIICDGCDKSINGIRYKCTLCPDYDLCSTCEQKETHPSDHNMLCIKVPQKSKYFMRGCGPWRQMRTAPYACSQFRCHKFKKEPSAQAKEGSKPEIDDLFSFVRKSASSLGFDPEVAVSQAQTFLQSMDHCNPPQETETQMGNMNDILMDFFKQCHSGSEKMENTDEGVSDNKSADAESHEAKVNNMKQDTYPVIIKDHIVDKESKKTDDVEMKDATNKNKDVPNQNGAIPSSSKDIPVQSSFPFLNQFGGNSIPDEQMKNLGQMFESIMQNIGSNLNSPNTSDKDNGSKDSSEGTNPDGYVFVNEKEKKDNENKEASFENQLNQALEQMTAMGFVNDGDWLKQLLIAKDLNISKVLDALNPPKN